VEKLKGISKKNKTTILKITGKIAALKKRKKKAIPIKLYSFEVFLIN
jgi:hypothetical protein